MNDGEGEDLAEIFGRISKAKEKRRSKEQQSVNYKDRHSMIFKKPPEDVRSVQFNLRISPRFKQHVSAMSIEEKISITEVLVKAFYHYRASKKS